MFNHFAGSTCRAVVHLLALTTTLFAATHAAAQGIGSGTGIGVAANGVCKTGVCPPVASPFSQAYTLPHNYNLAMPNGDNYQVEGVVQVGGDVGGCGGTQIFSVTYTGRSGGGTALGNALTFNYYWNCAHPATLFNVTHPFSTSFSAGVAATTTVTTSVLYNGTQQFPTRGPFSPPNPATASDFRQFNVSGGLFSNTTYSLNFGAGSAVGSTVWMGFFPFTPGSIVSSLLPTARTSSDVPAGADADGPLAFPAVTAFATMINTTTSAAVGCSLSAPIDLQGSFLFQRTDPATNAPVGSPNTLVDIAAGQSQSFYFAIAPTAAFSRDLVILANCVNKGSSQIITGLNTLILTASTTPISDMISIIATPTQNGILQLPSTTGSAAFGHATINIAAPGSVTFRAQDAPAGASGISLPLTLTLCQTDPATAQCLGTPPSPSVTVNVTNNQTLTFSVFAQATGAIPFDPGRNRIHVIATQGSVPVGAASVAVRTP